jgi:septal ring factor EnvC (AmiA/AmiB activator)
VRKSGFRISMSLLLGILVFSSISLKAQEIDDLQAEREKYLADILYTEELLSKTATNKMDQLSIVRLLSGKIKSRENVVASIRKEIIYLDNVIKQRGYDIKVLQDDLEILKKDYSRMIQKAYQTKKSYDKAQYILAANDFNQAYKRIRYMQQYNKFRREQAEEIREKTDNLKKQIEGLKNDQARKRDLLNAQQNEVARLNNEKKEKDQVVKSLSREEKNLRAQLNEKRSAMAKVEEEINRIMALATSGKEENSGMELTPEMKIISSEFGQNKGRFPWPVERGVITSRYGKHKHEVLKLVDVDNKGIYIATNPGANARCIFEGKVSNVISIKGANLTVIVQHGEYFTVYQNLVDLKIKKGDMLQSKQTIGKIYWDNKSSSSELHFELWKGNVTQNPELWLAK